VSGGGFDPWVRSATLNADISLTTAIQQLSFGVARGHIRIKSGDGWSARPWLCRPRRPRVFEKVLRRARFSRACVLFPKSVAPGTKGLGWWERMAVGTAIGALVVACKCVPSLCVSRARDGIYSCVSNCRLWQIYPFTTSLFCCFQLAFFFLFFLRYIGHQVTSLGQVFTTVRG
jgi:hypothetical protein